MSLGAIEHVECEMADRDTRRQSLRELESASRGELILQWRRLYHTEPLRYASLDFMRQAIAYVLQEREVGRLSAAARRELLTIAQGVQPVATNRTKIKPGTKLLREWGGRTHEIIVTDKGFAWSGITYRSLSAIAFAITGAKWSGRRFFGLTGGRDGSR